MDTRAVLVFDIETIGISFEKLDAQSQEFLLKYAQDDEEKKEAKERTALYPLTGEVIVIGLLNPATGKGKILARNDSGVALLETIGDFDVIGGTEKEILQTFWHLIQSYQTFVTFNGRSFDVPYLMIRSAICGIVPSKNLLSNRYVGSQTYGAQHIDLADQLGFYGAMRKGFNLHMWAKAFGIESPKEGSIHGEDVTPLYYEGKIIDIMKYNIGDVRATAELYERWEKCLNI